MSRGRRDRQSAFGPSHNPCMNGEALALFDGGEVQIGHQCGHQGGQVGIGGKPSAVAVRLEPVALPGDLDDVASSRCLPAALEAGEQAIDLLRHRLALGENAKGCIQKPEPLVCDPDLITQVVTSARPLSDLHGCSNPAFWKLSIVRSTSSEIAGSAVP
jgi:hypothetical protein